MKSIVSWYSCETGGQVIARDVPRFCTVCGGGSYLPLVDETSSPDRLRNLGLAPVGAAYRIFQCAYCGHLQWFKMNDNPPARERV